ncbi:tlde1 domain-containing protein [Desulfovibrio aminophilus]|uniref:tlde1 domain-containing protein n=2 Tax=Desulfovibrio aminophilus TaxID=81425 RepID=UPI000685D758|nr:tlde1 domain-containing protein [Desulfovibrio aminophilus]
MFSVLPAFVAPGEAGRGKARLENTLELPDWPNERNVFPGGTGGEQAQSRGKVFLPPPPPPSKGPYLIWSQSKGTLTDQDGNVLGNGYSGKGTPGEKDAGRNNPGREGEENVGPIPRGNWRVVEITDENYRPDLARPIFKLEPDTETEARVNSMGRKPRSFLVHGDNAESDASEGCIILNYPTRSMLKKYKDKVIHVSE